MKPPFHMIKPPEHIIKPPVKVMKPPVQIVKTLLTYQNPTSGRVFEGVEL